MPSSQNTLVPQPGSLGPQMAANSVLTEGLGHNLDSSVVHTAQTRCTSRHPLQPREGGGKGDSQHRRVTSHLQGTPICSSPLNPHTSPVWLFLLSSLHDLQAKAKRRAGTRPRHTAHRRRSWVHTQAVILSHMSKVNSKDGTVQTMGHGSAGKRNEIPMHSTVWMSLGSMLSKKKTQSLHSIGSTSWKCLEQAHPETESRVVVAQAAVTSKGYRVSFKGDEIVLKLDRMLHAQP